MPRWPACLSCLCVLPHSRLTLTIQAYHLLSSSKPQHFLISLALSPSSSLLLRLITKTLSPVRSNHPVPYASTHILCILLIPSTHCPPPLALYHLGLNTIIKHSLPLPSSICQVVASPYNSSISPPIHHRHSTQSAIYDTSFTSFLRYQSHSALPAYKT